MSGRATVLAFVATLGLLAVASPGQEDLDQLIEVVETTYVGYHLAVKGSRDAEYRQFVVDLRARARATPGGDEIVLLREYVEWFDDGHLFIVESPKPSAERTLELAARTPRFGTDPVRLRERLEDTDAGLDPLEGIWFDGWSEIAIVRDGAGFAAVVIESGHPLWITGQVKARFDPAPDERYRVTLRADDHAPIRAVASLQKDLLLHMPPRTWARRAPLRPHQAGLVDRDRPRAPTAHVREPGGVVVFSIPSHDPTFRVTLEDLIETHAEALASSRLLVIDLRGNEGGSAGTTRGLMPYIRSETLRPAIGASGPPVVLACEPLARYYEGLMEQGWVPADLPERMRRSSGQVIPFDSDAAADDEPSGKPVARAHPERVAILVDRHVVSAGEAFLLQARRSTKVTVYGEPTGGAIDYQNVMLKRLSSAERGILVGLPTIAASADLPRDGLNARGIPVDVPMAVRGVDAIQAVIDHDR